MEPKTKQIQQDRSARPVRQRRPQSPQGMIYAESKILHDTPLYQAKGAGGVIPATGLMMFNAPDRIGKNREFLCNLSKAGEIPFGVDVEVKALSLYVNLRDDGAEDVDPTLATAEELYDLLSNCGYIEINDKSGRHQLKHIPISQIPQLNGVTGSSGASGAPKYTLGRGGMLKLAEPFVLRAGEIFSATLGLFEQDNGAGYSPVERWNEAVNVIKNFKFNMHVVEVSEPYVAGSGS